MKFFIPSLQTTHTYTLPSHRSLLFPTFTIVINLPFSGLNQALLDFSFLRYLQRLHRKNKSDAVLGSCILFVNFYFNEFDSSPW